MSEIENESYDKAYKPYDVVSDSPATGGFY